MRGFAFKALLVAAFLPAVLAVGALTGVFDVGAALAQVPVNPDAPAVATSVTVKSISDQLWGLVFPLMGSLVATVGSALGVYIFRAYGIKIEMLQRENLDAAVLSAAGLIKSKIDTSAQGVVIDVNSVVMRDAINYVLRMSPDAVKYFDLAGKTDDLARKIASQLPSVPDMAATVQVPATPPTKL